VAGEERREALEEACAAECRKGRGAHLQGRGEEVSGRRFKGRHRSRAAWLGNVPCSQCLPPPRLQHSKTTARPVSPSCRLAGRVGRHVLPNSCAGQGCGLSHQPVTAWLRSRWPLTAPSSYQRGEQHGPPVVPRWHICPEPARASLC
jgi:hypothetical protein